MCRLQCKKKFHLFEDVLRLIYVYVLQGGKGFGLQGEWDMHSSGDLVMCLDDFNRHIDGFDMVHGGCCVDQRNLEERSFMSFVWRRNYACQIYGLTEMNRRR